MKNVLLVLAMLLSMTSAFAQKSVSAPLDCSLAKFSSPAAYQACCQANPKSCGYVGVNCRDIKDSVPPTEFAACCKVNPRTCGNANGGGNGGGNHCPKGWLEVIKCGYGIDYQNCGCLSAPIKK